MYKFSRLFIKNILFALLFNVLLGVLSFILLNAYIQEQTQLHQKKIQSIGQQFSLDNNEKPEDVAKKIGKILSASTTYQTLVIKYNSSTVFKYGNKNERTLNQLLTNTKSIPISKLNLQVQFQLSFPDLLNFLTLLSIGVIALSLVFVIISATLNYRLQSSIFRKISKQIGNELSRVNDPKFITEQSSKNSVLDIPELQAGIKDIKALMKTQIMNTSTLEVEAHIDSLTGVENRNRFVQYYENNIAQDSPIKFGVLLITRCSELQTINKTHGYSYGDNYIVKIADIIKNALSTRPEGKIFRLNSSDFATILPNQTFKVAEEYASELTTKFNHYQEITDIDSVAFTGLVSFDKSKPLGELLALADTGVSVAQTQKTNSWYSQKDIDILTNNSANFGSQNWRQEIESVLENGRINLLLQPILPSGRNSKVYSEVLARFLNANDDMLPTATFIAMAEKLDKIVAVDRLIIETAIKEISSKNMLENSYGINISARSINDEHFMIWLERKLLREPSAARRLVFEISELGLQQNIKTAKRLVEVLHRVGSRVTVERFGVGLTSFKFFRDLTPDYIKMDSSYTRDIDDDKNNQYFLRLMVDLAHRLGISVLAESVESQEEKHTLEKLFIDGCQGYYVGKPAQLS